MGWTLKLETQVTSKGTGPSLPSQLLRFRPVSGPFVTHLRDISLSTLISLGRQAQGFLGSYL